MVQGRECQIRGPNKILDFNTSSERPLSKLSENHVIGPTELKLWPFKDALFNARSPSFESTRVGSVTRVLMVQFKGFSDFLEA